jgi:hypothetical protein
MSPERANECRGHYIKKIKTRRLTVGFDRGDCLGGGREDGSPGTNCYLWAPSGAGRISKFTICGIGADGRVPVCGLQQKHKRSGFVRDSNALHKTVN